MRRFLYSIHLLVKVPELSVWLVFLLLQDWQEIVSMYEADSVYLGKLNMKYPIESAKSLRLTILI